MKTHIEQVEYMNLNKLGKCWVWNAFCDKCGNQFRSRNVFSFSEPDENEKDYCLNCMREMIDDNLLNQGEDKYEKY